MFNGAAIRHPGEAQEVNRTALNNLGLVDDVKPRRLQAREWIRHHTADSRVLTEIAHDAFMENKDSHRTAVFVDPGAVDAATVTCWDGDRGSYGARLEAVRVPCGIANILSTACEKDGKGLAEILGEEYDRLKVDLDLPSNSAHAEEEHFQWPSCLQTGLALNPAAPTIISLRTLEEDAISAFTANLPQSTSGSETPIQILNWQGPELDRAQVLALFKRIGENTPAEEHRHLPAYLIDNILSNGDDLVMLCASWIRQIREAYALGLRLTPINIDTFVRGGDPAWMTPQSMTSTQTSVMSGGKSRSMGP